MLDQLSNFEHSNLLMIIWATFSAALLSSVHCMGMCGGLVVAVSDQKFKNNLLYQLGRLFSYLIMAAMAGAIGKQVLLVVEPGVSSLISIIFMGLFFIYLGIKILKKNTLDFSLPKFLSGLQSKAYQNIFKNKIQSLRSFLIGSVSILLPCGFLYAVIIALAATQDPILAMIGIFTFWLGTLPAMVMAPQFFSKVLRPLIQKFPKTVSFGFISIGMLTMSWRVWMLYTQKSCH